MIGVALPPGRLSSAQPVRDGTIAGVVHVHTNRSDGLSSPDEIAAKLEKLRALGVEYVLLNGGGPARDNLRRFARELMPAFANNVKRVAVSAE